MNSARFSGLFLALGLTTALPVAAQSNSDDTSFTVSVTVQNACTIATTTNVAFGSVFSAAPATDAVGELAVNCGATGISYSVALNDGVNAVAAGARRMADGGATNFISYDLYQDNARSVVWGAGTDALAGATTASGDNALPVYATMQAGTYPEGDYQDTVTATITF